MLDVIVHRGPDDRGVWLGSGLALGHSRLSILDLSPRGHQPLVTGDGMGVLTYNGEVYNYLDLRNDLEREGILFSGQTDTEAVRPRRHDPIGDDLMRVSGT